MSFAAEPFGVFVDDLVGGLTGAVVREAFTFLDDGSYRLGFSSDFLASTLRMHGIVAGAYFRFTPAVDFSVDDDGTLHWLESAPSVPKAGAHWPDRGTDFFANYERKPEGRPAPTLTDRNAGSVVRTLADSFAREYAVLSKQLELVYRAGFLGSANARDLEQVAALVGIRRRTRTFAVGEVVFSRTTPAPADIFVPAGTLISTGQPPQVTVETTEARTLRSGTISVSIPVASQVTGPAGVAGAQTLTVIHRPILGVEASSNPKPMIFGGEDETDDALRGRAERALETSGAATLGALIGALTTIEGIRDRDVRAVEDHLAFPGTVKLTIAADLDEDTAREAARVIESTRPAGIRVLHNLPVAPAIAQPPSDGGGADGSAPTSFGAPVATAGTSFPVGIFALVTPASSTLNVAQKAVLSANVEATLRAAVAEYGIGEPVIYNQLVAKAMAVDGVYDFALELYRAAPGASASGRFNLLPQPPDTRAQLTVLDVKLRGALIALDVSADVARLGLAAEADQGTVLAATRDDIGARLTRFVTGAGRPAQIDASSLLAALPATTDYKVTRLSYTVELLDEGLRILRDNVAITPDPEQQLWIRSVAVAEKDGS